MHRVVYWAFLESRLIFNSSRILTFLSMLDCYIGFHFSYTAQLTNLVKFILKLADFYDFNKLCNFKTL